MKTQNVLITAPKFQIATFEVEGIAPLVIHRFSAKTKEEMLQKQEIGKAASSMKKREPRNSDDVYNEARYLSKEGWDGFHAGAIRNGMISACRLEGFKMTLAKLSLFVIQDGWDEKEPQIPLVRIYGKSEKQEDVGRVDTGQPYITIRSAFYKWSAKITIRWDADQFTVDNIFCLLSRVGEQVGICEGRPDSPNSAGMGWGLFKVKKGQITNG